MKKKETKAKKGRHTTLDEEKDIVILDMKNTPLDYNLKVIESYMAAAKASSIVVGIELGKMYGFIASKTNSIEDAEVLIDTLDRLLNIHTEAGTYNGLKKIVPFKFKKISRKERSNMIQELKKGFVKPKKKPEVPIYSG